MREAVIVSAVHTPVGKMGGGLATLKPYELGALAIKEAIKRAGISNEMIDEVMFGNVTNKEYCNVARVTALEAGLPVTTPAITLDRQCGSALNTLANAAILISAGVHNVVVGGGVEMDSNRPWIMKRVDQAYQMAPPKFFGPIFAPERFGDVHVLTTAENVAEKYSLTREECDEFAFHSQLKAKTAWENGKFDEEVIPVEVKTRKTSYVVDRDETIRDTTMESLARLKVVTGRPDGVVTAGNSSPNCDGASAMVVMEKELAKERGCEILGTYRGYAAVGVDPAYMGMGPAFAIPKLLNSCGLTLEDIDLFEINEAFASQSLACIKELNLDVNKLNVNGGAIALGHPMGATGGILTAKLLYELRRTGGRYGIISFCCGGGQGVAVLLENEAYR